MHLSRRVRMCVTFVATLIMVVDPAIAGWFGGCGGWGGGGYSCGGGGCGGSYYHGGCGSYYGGCGSSCGGSYFGSPVSTGYSCGSACGGCGSWSCGGDCHSYSSCSYSGYDDCSCGCGSSCGSDCGCSSSCGCDCCGETVAHVADSCGCESSCCETSCGCDVSCGCETSCCETSCGCDTCDSGCGCGDGYVVHSGYDSGYVVSDGYDTGCSTCASGGEVVYEGGYGDSYDGGVVYEEAPAAGSGTRNEAPSSAPAPTPADAGSTGPEDMFDDPPAPDEPADDMFDDGSDDSGDDMDDLFPASVQMRTWTDNTGNFTTQARLVELGDDSVRLLKENGRHCTVPFHRLSSADFQLVQRVAAARGQAIPLRLAQR